jgi:hypothetical protein
MIVHEGRHCVGELVDAPAVIGWSESLGHGLHRIVACRACAIVLEREGQLQAAGQLRDKAADLEASIVAHATGAVSPSRGALCLIPAARRPWPGGRRG